MRVLLISHTCQSRSEGQPKAQFLGAHSDLELRVLVPHRWKRYGAWRAPETPENPSFDFQIGRVLLPWSGPGQTYLHFYPTLPAILREFRPDVIDLWEEPWSLVAAQTCFWRDRLLSRAKIVAETEQNIDKKLPPPFEPFRSYVLKRADFVVGRNRESLEIVRRKGYRGAARVVPNAVDTSLFGAQNRAFCREKWGVSGFVVGYAGRLVEEKGIGDLVESLAFCDEKINLVLVGGGPFENELKRQISVLKLENRVRFLGAQPLEALPPIFGALDCLVLPSRTTSSWKEQFGRVLIEAAACQIPVIGSDSGAIPEVIGEGDDALGLVFPETDARALAQAITRLQNEPDLARKLGETGARRAKSEFSWQQVAARMAEIYRAI